MLIKNLIDIYLRHSSEVSVFLSFGWFHILSAFFWGWGQIQIDFPGICSGYAYVSSQTVGFFPFWNSILWFYFFETVHEYGIVCEANISYYSIFGTSLQLWRFWLTCSVGWTFFLKKFICSSNPLSVRLPVSHMYAWFLHFRIILTCLTVSLAVCFKSL